MGLILVLLVYILSRKQLPRYLSDCYIDVSTDLMLRVCMLLHAGHSLRALRGTHFPMVLVCDPVFRSHDLSAERFNPIYAVL